MSMGGSGVFPRGHATNLRPHQSGGPTTQPSHSAASSHSAQRRPPQDMPSNLFSGAESAFSEEQKEQGNRRTRFPKSDALQHQSVQSEHTGMIHDVAWDYYGRRFATAGQDGSIFIYEVEETAAGQQVAQKATKLEEHHSPIWKVAWGPPLHEQNLLAAASFDRTVSIFREAHGKWEKINTNIEHQNSVNCVAWAPGMFGLILASCSTDGSVQLMSQEDGWKTKKFGGIHKEGINSIQFLPVTQMGSFFAKFSEENVLTLATCGNDNKVKVLYFDKSLTLVKEETIPAGHTDIVRAVAWAPPYYHKGRVLASCGNDGKVMVSREEVQSDQDSELDSTSWVSQEVVSLKSDVHCETIQWNLMGTLLIVGSSDNVIRFYGEVETGGEWVLKGEKELANEDSGIEEEEQGDNGEPSLPQTGLFGQ